MYFHLLDQFTFIQISSCTFLLQTLNSFQSEFLYSELIYLLFFTFLQLLYFFCIVEYNTVSNPAIFSHLPAKTRVHLTYTQTFLLNSSYTNWNLSLSTDMDDMDMDIPLPEELEFLESNSHFAEQEQEEEDHHYYFPDLDARNLTTEDLEKFKWS